MEKAYGINVVQNKHSGDPNFTGKPLFLKLCNKCSRPGHSISTCPDRKYTKSAEPIDKPRKSQNKH